MTMSLHHIVLSSALSPSPLPRPMLAVPCARPGSLEQPCAAACTVTSDATSDATRLYNALKFYKQMERCVRAYELVCHGHTSPACLTARSQFQKTRLRASLSSRKCARPFPFDFCFLRRSVLVGRTCGYEQLLSGCVRFRSRARTEFGPALRYAELVSH